MNGEIMVFRYTDIYEPGDYITFGGRHVYEVLSFNNRASTYHIRRVRRWRLWWRKVRRWLRWPR